MVDKSILERMLAGKNRLKITPSRMFAAAPGFRFILSIHGFKGNRWLLDMINASSRKVSPGCCRGSGRKRNECPTYRRRHPYPCDRLL